MPKALKTKQNTLDVINAARLQRQSGSIGIIVDYNRYQNTATVVISKDDTDEINDILRGVPCPTTMGIQTVAPEPGRVCWVIFKNGNITQPIISHFYNHRYAENDYEKQSKTPMGIPSYLIG